MRSMTSQTTIASLALGGTGRFERPCLAAASTAKGSPT